MDEISNLSSPGLCLWKIVTKKTEGNGKFTEQSGFL